MRSFPYPHPDPLPSRERVKEGSRVEKHLPGFLVEKQELAGGNYGGND